MPNTPVTEAQLTKGTVIRFKQSLFAKGQMTVRLTDDAEVRPAGEHGNLYAIVWGVRVRPADHSVRFGSRKVYCVNVDRIEIAQEA